MSPSDASFEDEDLDLLRQWAGTALGAVLSLWNSEKHHAYRDSQPHLLQSPGYFPTATFHSILAQSDAGVWHPNTIFNQERGILETPYVTCTIGSPPSRPEAILEGLVSIQAPGTRRSERPDAWFASLLGQSSHHSSASISPRHLIVLEKLFAALAALLDGLHSRSIPDALLLRLSEGAKAAQEHFRKILSLFSELEDESRLFNSRFFPPYILMLIASFLRLRRSVTSCLPGFSHDDLEEFDLIEESVANCLRRHLDFQAARERLPSDPSYDTMSLAFAAQGLTALASDVKGTPFFEHCIEAVVTNQNSDGCWADGISVAYVESGDVVQLPSIAVALALSEALFRSRDLIEVDPASLRLLRSGLPALDRMASYLRTTFHPSCEGRPMVSGWTSDRTRWPRMSEAWITSMAARVLLRSWLCHTAVLRAQRLSKFGISSFRASSRPFEELSSRWRSEIIEPDHVVKPMETVWRNLVSPILLRTDRGDYFYPPPRNSVSFLLFGPPGSGKTFFVRTLSRFLGWPLVLLNPGHFIANGLELIEATSREIFSNLERLDHALVLLDECDELFRDRTAGVERDSILAFATASMLPKLQDLHDKRSIVFLLATNFLHRIDPAVRRPGRFDHVLLLDRPDATARRKILENFGGPNARREDELQELIKQTAGLTVKEIYEAADGPSGSPALYASSLQDYRDWCSAIAPRELQAWNPPRHIQDGVTDRWKEFE